MKIAAAQIQSIKGDVATNIERHIAFIESGIEMGADIIFFPELSLTGYEPALANQLATYESDARFNALETISNQHRIVIVAGMPLQGDSCVLIGMLIFQPATPRSSYCKQYLHEDECAYFVPGNRQAYLYINNDVIAPAICYESLLPAHAQYAVKGGATAYVASVAKSAGGLVKAYQHYPEIARHFSMPIVMANSIGYCDNFESVGGSAAWSKEGLLLGKLNGQQEGILLVDTLTNAVIKKIISI